MGDLGVDPSAGVTLAHTHGGCGGETGKKGLAVVGLTGDGSALAVFPAASEPPLAARAALPADVRGVTGAVSSVTDLVGTGGGLLELRQGGGGSVAISLSSGKGAGACAVSGLEGVKEARLCAGEGCALSGGVSLSGKTFVASAAVVGGGERAFKFLACYQICLGVCVLHTGWRDQDDLEVDRVCDRCFFFVCLFPPVYRWTEPFDLPVLLHSWGFQESLIEFPVRQPANPRRSPNRNSATFLRWR